MKTTTIKFNYAESLKSYGKTIIYGLVKEMLKVLFFFKILNIIYLISLKFACLLFC